MNKNTCFISTENNFFSHSYLLKARRPCSSLRNSRNSSCKMPLVIVARFEPNLEFATKVTLKLRNIQVHCNDNSLSVSRDFARWQTGIFGDVNRGVFVQYLRMPQKWALTACVIYCLCYKADGEVAGLSRGSKSSVQSTVSTAKGWLLYSLKDSTEFGQRKFSRYHISIFQDISQYTPAYLGHKFKISITFIFNAMCKFGCLSCLVGSREGGLEVLLRMFMSFQFQKKAVEYHAG
jgi:hypothetical protein